MLEDASVSENDKKAAKLFVDSEGKLNEDEDYEEALKMAQEAHGIFKTTGSYNENDDLVFKVDMSTASDAVMVAVAPPVASPPTSLEFDCHSLRGNPTKCESSTSCYWGERPNTSGTLRNRLRRNEIMSCHQKPSS